MIEAVQKTKIAVVGAGAVGSLIGGLLARAGEDVTLIARPEHAAAIRADGLRIQGMNGSLMVPIRAVEALDFSPDLVLLGVKTQDVEAVCREISGQMAGGTPLITLQNGVRSDAIAARVLPDGNIIGGVVLFNAQYLEPGKITYARGGALVIGESSGKNGQHIQAVQALLNRAIPTTLSDNIQGAHWTKLLVNNMANGLEAMTGLTVRACMGYGSLRKISILAMKEGYRTIQKAGIRLAPLPGVPQPVLSLLVRLPLPMTAGILRLSIGSMNTLSSTLQSLRRGRPTEIEYLNGEIVRLGQQVGLPTPVNAKIVELVKNVEKTGQFYSPDELSRIFSIMEERT